jgi:ABC-type glycerol-3-phosphate transport system substrate-binding protein
VGAPQATSATAAEEVAEGGEERVLVLWTHTYPTFTDGLLTKWIPEFEAANPGVKVHYESFPYSGEIVSFDSKLLAEVSSGGGPDVWAMASHNFTQAGYIEAGLLAPLDLDIFGYSSLDDLLRDFPQNTLNVFIRDGKVYALLNELTTLCLFYNKDVFDEIGVAYPSADKPTSWESLGEISQQMLITDTVTGLPERMGYQFGFFANYPAAEWYIQAFYPIMRQYGQPELFDGSQPAGDGKAIVKTLQVFYDYTHKHRAYDPFFFEDWFSSLANGKVAMVTAGSWFPSAIRALRPDVRLGVAPHPVVDPEDPDTYHNIMYSFGWVVNANSDPEQQELAQQFLAFILGKKGEVEQPLWWLENVGLSQPRLSMLESEDYRELLAQDPWLGCFFDVFDTFQVDYYQHSSDEAGAAVVRAVDRVVYDKMAPADSARLLQNELLLLP